MFWITFFRDWKVSWKLGCGALYELMLYAIVILSEGMILSKRGDFGDFIIPSMITVGVMVMYIGERRVLEIDYEEGMLEQMYLRMGYKVLLYKLITHWIISSMCLSSVLILSMMMYGYDMDTIIGVCAVSLVCSLLIRSINMVGSSLGLGLNSGTGMAMRLVMAPLIIPVVMIGVYVHASMQHLGDWNYFSLLIGTFIYVGLLGLNVFATDSVIKAIG